MSSGFIEIAALGQQDVYLTGSPDVTYFSSVYKRHTPFVLETFEVPFKASSITMGQNNIVRIPAKGDLIRATTLKLTLPPLAVYGQDWFWPTISNDLPFVIFSGDTIDHAGVNSIGLQYFSSNTESFNMWNASHGVPMNYDANLNKFVFYNPNNSVSNIGVNSVHSTFFGFDIRNAVSTDGTYFYYNYVNGSIIPDFTLEQAGWTRNIGIPVNTLSGLFLNLERPAPLAQNGFLNYPHQIPGNIIGYLNFSQNDTNGLLWTNYDTPAVYTITPGGRIQFKNKGIYTIRVYIPTSSLVLYGSDFGDGIPSNFTFKNRQQTIGPITTFPIIVTDNSNYYFFVGTDTGTIDAGSYFSLSPTDDVFVITSEIANTGPEPIITFDSASNTTQPGGTGLSPVTAGYFQFNRVTNWLVSGSLGIHIQTEVLSNINIYNDNGLYATYDFTGQEGNPTVVFSIPIADDRTWDDGFLWNFTVVTEPPGSDVFLSPGSYITFTNLALPIGSPSGGDILPYNGLLFNLGGGQNNGGIFDQQVEYGVENIITTNQSDLNTIQFSNAGTYMVTVYLPDATDFNPSDGNVPPKLLPIFDSPSGITFAPGRGYYVSDIGNNCIRLVSADGLNVSTILGNGQPGFVDGFGKDAYFKSPQGICVDITTDPEFPKFYIADTGNHCIRRFDIEDVNLVTTLAGNGTAGYVNGTGSAARFNSPVGIAFDATSRLLYVADTGNHTIRSVNVDTGETLTVAGNGTAGNAAPATPANARFRSPQGIITWRGEQGDLNIRVTDTGNYVIRAIVIGYAVSVIHGTPGVSGHADGYPGLFEGPKGITAFVDPLSNFLVKIFITDGNYVREIDSDTNQVLTYSGSETAGYVEGSSYNNPTGIFYSHAQSGGAAAVCDTGNFVIRTLGGYTISGNPATGAAANNPAGINALYQNNATPTIINFIVRATSDNFLYTLQNQTPQFSYWAAGSFAWVYPITSTVVPPEYSQYHYYDSVGTWAIQSADLKIGGQSIQTLTGEYIEIWNDLNVPYENQPALKLLTGKYDTTIASGRDYYVNLPFYFYEKSQNYLPMCSLSRQDVEIHITFRTLQALTAIQVDQTNPVQATLIVEYVYLDTPELNWFTKTRLEYMIDQAQYQEIDMAAGLTQDNFLLNFRNPVNALFFAIQVNGALPYDWSNDGLQRMGLSFNGEEIMLNRITDATQLGVIEPFNNFINFPTRNFYIKTFKSPINFSRIRYVLLGLNILRSDAYYPAKQLRITAVSKNVLQINDGLGGLMFISQ
jgi:Major capsid protein N-terminus/NHL repeat